MIVEMIKFSHFDRDTGMACYIVSSGKHCGSGMEDLGSSMICM